MKLFSLPLHTVKQPDERGFTLVELLSVMVMLGLLVALGMVGYANVLNRAARAQADVYWHELNTAAMSYQLERGKYPTDLAALEESDRGSYLTSDIWTQAVATEDTPWGDAPLLYDVVPDPGRVCVWAMSSGKPQASGHNDKQLCSLPAGATDPP